MASNKLYPKKQQIISSDLADGDNVALSRVKIVTSDDFLDLPGVAIDVAFLESSLTASDPTFYMSNSNTRVNLGNATVNTEYIVVSRHAGLTNYAPGDNTDPTRPK